MRVRSASQMDWVIIVISYDVTRQPSCFDLHSRWLIASLPGYNPMMGIRVRFPMVRYICPFLGSGTSPVLLQRWEVVKRHKNLGTHRSSVQRQWVWPIRIVQARWRLSSTFSEFRLLPVSVALVLNCIDKTTVLRPVLTIFGVRLPLSYQFDNPTWIRISATRSDGGSLLYVASFCSLSVSMFCRAWEASPWSFLVALRAVKNQ